MDIFGDNKKGIDQIVNLPDLSKSNLLSIATSVVDAVNDGNEDALEQFLKAKGLSELSAAIMDGLKYEAVREASKYSESQTILGCGVSVKSGSKKYDFSNNPEWVDLVKKIDELSTKKKELEKLMIDASNYAQVVDKDGVIVPAAVIVSSGADTLMIKLPK